jgi:transcriptional regulator with XRE-family HTH domain
MPRNDSTRLGQRLQRLRELATLSQSELAGRAGLSVRSIQNWECGRRRPKLDAMLALARALGVSVEQLVTG